MPSTQPTTIRPLSGLRLAQAVNDIEASGPDREVVATNLIASAKRNGKLSPTKAQLADAITAIEPQGNLQGSSSIVISMVDPEWELLDSTFFDTNNDSEIDPIDLNYPDKSEYWWRLTQVSPRANHTIQLTFINLYAAKLMALKGPVKADRASVTRAEFLKGLAKKVPQIEFYSGQLDTKQPIDRPKQAATTPNRAPGKAHKTVGIGANTSSLTVKGNKMTNAQMNVANVILGVCEQEAAVTAVREAAIFAAIVESDLSESADNGTYWGALSGSHRNFPNQDDTAGMTKAFIRGGKGFQSAATLTQTKTDIAAIASQAEGAVPYNSAGISKQYLSQSGYGSTWNAVKEAQAIVQAGGGGSTGSIDQAQSYYFTVGTSSDPHETYWDAMQRLAQEVNWVLVLDGPRMYFDSEMTLIRQKPVAEIHRDQLGVSDWNYDWDARQIATQMTIVLICDPFDFHAGDCFKLDAFGPASTGSTAKLPGRWLISEIDRDVHKADGTFSLKQPSLPKREPAPSIRSVSISGTGAAAGTALAAYQWAQRLSDLALPYSKSTRQLVDPPPSGGYDCSASTAWILWKAGMYTGPTGWAWVSSEFAAQWGDPGPGQEMTVWANADHIFIEFHIPSLPHMQANTSGLGPGPRFGPWGGNGQADAASGAFTARHWPGT